MTIDVMHFAIAVGSNIGDRLGYLNRALGLIDRIDGLDIIATSRVYESKGWGRNDLEPFLNAMIACRARNLTPRALLTSMQGIEDELGRQRSVKWGARTLDLDLIAADDLCSDAANLTLPHPWIAKRPFVYLPFQEVAQVHSSWNVLAQPDEEGKRIEQESWATSMGSPVWGRQFIPTAETCWTSNSEEATSALARRLAQWLHPGDTVLLTAPMGAGKSIFARGVARGLGVEGPVPSPTFTLCRAYDTTHGTLEHWDFYRLESLDDLESTGFFTPESRSSIRLIEWAERFPDAVSDPYCHVEITPIDADRRNLAFRTSNPSLPFPLRALAMTADCPTT